MSTEKTTRRVNKGNVTFAVIVVMTVIAGIIIANWHKFDFGGAEPDPVVETENISTVSDEIPFAEILAKISSETECQLEVTDVTMKPSVEEQAGNLKIQYQLGERKALIFDRDSLTLEANKIPDDYIIGNYFSSERVTSVVGQTNMYSCEDSETVARILLFDVENSTLELLWENESVFFDKYLPINAISSIDEFNNSIKPNATNGLFDESKMIVNINETGSTLYFNVAIENGCIAIIQTTSDYYVISDQYIDPEVANIGPNRYSLNAKVVRVLMYSPTEHLIQLIYTEG